MGFAGGDPLIFSKKEFYEDVLPSLLWPDKYQYNLDEGQTLACGTCTGLTIKEVYHYNLLSTQLKMLCHRLPNIDIEYFHSCSNTNTTLYSTLYEDRDE